MADLSKLRFNGTDYNVKDASAPTRKFNNAYSKTGNLPITSDDTTQTAIGKLENCMTPKNDLADVVDNGAKNIVNCYDLDAIKAINNADGTWSGNEFTRRNARFTVKGDGTIGVKTVGQTSGESTFYLPIPEMENYGSYVLSGCPEGGTTEPTNGYLFDYQYIRNGSTVYIIDTGDSHSFTYRTTDTEQRLIIIVRNQTTISSEIIFKPMICTKSQSDISDKYEPYALGNQVITPAMIQKVDEGAKNIAVPSVFGSVTGLTITQSNGHYVVSGTTTASFTQYIYNPSSAYVCTETMVALGAKVATGAPPMVQYVDPENTRRYVAIPLGSYIIIPAGSSIEKIYFQKQGSSSLTINIDYYMMICTLADWNVSHKWVPYLPDWKSVGATVKSLWTDTFSPVSAYSDNVSNIEGGYSVIGKLVVVNIRCTLRPDVNSWIILITGLPKPSVQYNTGNGAVCLAINKGESAILTGQGAIGVTGNIASGETLLISGAYIAY